MSRVYTLSLPNRLALELQSNSEVITAKAHAAIARGKVVQIDIATGDTSAPADNDRLGLFGVAVNAVASGAEGSFKIRGYVEVMTGDTSAVGTFMNPMADMMVNTVATQTDGNGFCKLLETGVDGAVKKALIVNQ